MTHGRRGQQRLTTLLFLLCAIRDHVNADDARLAEKTNDLYLFNRFADGQERYTLLPTQADPAVLDQTPGTRTRRGRTGSNRRCVPLLPRTTRGRGRPDDPHDIARIVIPTSRTCLRYVSWS